MSEGWRKPESVVDGKLLDRPATVIPLELQDARAVHNCLDARDTNHIGYEKIDGIIEYLRHAVYLLFLVKLNIKIYKIVHFRL